MRNEAAERKYYIDGNTVRRMEAAPVVTRPDRRVRESRPEHVTRERRERERRERERELELRNRKRAARRNQERALRMSKSYVAFLTMAVMVFGIFTGAYIHIQSEMTARMNQISSLESLCHVDVSDRETCRFWLVLIFHQLLVFQECDGDVVLSNVNDYFVCHLLPCCFYLFTLQSPFSCGFLH